MPDLVYTIKRILKDIYLFCESSSAIHLRTYQSDPAYAIINSVINRKGYSFVVIFPRQSGKNELQAQIECYLLCLFSTIGGDIVKISPTWKPQSINAMRRLDSVLSNNIIMRGLDWRKDQGYMYRVGNARMTFLSGAPTSNVVGATASLLLECDEAQDVSIEKWDKEIAPMAASTNATRVFWGTAWTSKTLLSREMRASLSLQNQDGIQRVFIADADVVGSEVPSYQKYVEEEVRKHGRSHPFILTQYYSKEIDAETGMFPDSRIALMFGDHSILSSPLQSDIYAFTLDIAGGDETITSDPTSQSSSSKHDATSLTIFLVDLTTLDDPIICAPTYRVVNRLSWTDVAHSELYAKIKSLCDTWNPRYVVVDSTGVGEGLYSFLNKSFPNSIIPYKFTQKSKSLLGWGFLSVIETGRYKEYTPSDALQDLFFLQCRSVEMDILPGPNKIMRWSVPDTLRDSITGDFVHDDLLISSSLISVLDDYTFGKAQSTVIDAFNPLDNMEF
jgi:hypothetical protein